MRPSLNRLENAEVIHISVVVQVKVRKHIRRIVQKNLEILHGRRLGERRSHGLKIEMKRYVIVRSDDLRRGDGTGLGDGDRGPVGRNGAHGHARSHGDDTGDTAAGKENRQHRQKSQSGFHITAFPQM